jgi:hypothetical protein
MVVLRAYTHPTLETAVADYPINLTLRETEDIMDGLDATEDLLDVLTKPGGTWMRTYPWIQMQYLIFACICNTAVSAIHKYPKYPVSKVSILHWHEYPKYPD